MSLKSGECDECDLECSDMISIAFIYVSVCDTVCDRSCRLHKGFPVVFLYFLFVEQGLYHID